MTALRCKCGRFVAPDRIPLLCERCFEQAFQAFVALEDVTLDEAVKRG